MGWPTSGQTKQEITGTFLSKTDQGFGSYLGHFGVPAPMAFLHLTQDIDIQKAFHLVPVLERVSLCGLLLL